MYGTVRKMIESHGLNEISILACILLCKSHKSHLRYAFFRLNRNFGYEIEPIIQDIPDFQKVTGRCFKDATAPRNYHADALFILLPSRVYTAVSHTI